MWRAKPDCASRLTWSSTRWMLIGSRSTGRSSENTSMRSTSFTMRSASSQISRVKRAVVVAGGLLEQLRRAADARQRVLDLVRQHRGERADRARSAPMGELAIHLVGDGALLQHDHDMVGPLRQRRDMKIDKALAGIARRRRDRPCIRSPRRRDGAPARSAPATGCRTARDRAALPAQQQHRSLEEIFRRDIGVGDLAVGVDDDDRHAATR